MFHMSQRYIGRGEQFRRNRGSNEETENPGRAAGERGEHGGGGERGGETRGGGGEPREVASQASLGKDKRCR